MLNQEFLIIEFIFMVHMIYLMEIIFVYGGTIVSIGDIGLHGINNVKDALNMVGNTHGSILSINDKHYIFYHRQTNQNCFSRQACVEEIKILPNGKINQVEVTSCGLNNGLLLGKGEYSSRIACNLICKKVVNFIMLLNLIIDLILLKKIIFNL